VRAASARVSCQNRLRQIGLALTQYHDANESLPPRRRTTPTPNDPEEVLSWTVLTLPFLEQEALYADAVAACRQDAEPRHHPPHWAMQRVVPILLCPSDGRFSTPKTDSFGLTSSFTSYIATREAYHPVRKQGKLGALGDSPGARFADITDGMSNTVAVGERPPPDSLQAGLWYPSAPGYGSGNRGPNNSLIYGIILPFADPCSLTRAFGPGRTENPCDRFHMWSLHGGGANFLYCDASVRFLPYSSEELLYSLVSRSGGEATPVE
jgi:prepilin-type processing-associated H-X9-DG protein